MSHDALTRLLEDEMVHNSEANDTANIGLVETALSCQFLKGD